MAILVPLPYILIFALDFSYKEIVSWGLIIATYSFIILIILPIKGTRKIKIDPAKTKVDERDIMFARRNLVKGDGRYEDYYNRRPENLESDEQFRKKPGILGIGSSYYNPAMFASSDVSFYMVNQLKNATVSSVSAKKQNLDPVRLANYLKKWAKSHCANCRLE